MRIVIRLLLLFALLPLIPGCASTAVERHPNDPLEALNRPIFHTNEAVSDLVIGPLSDGYRAVVPEWTRKGVRNAVRNLGEPLSAISHMLSFDIDAALATSARFLLNSTFGVAGLDDVSTGIGLPQQRRTLGQAFGAWGVPDGPFVVAPLLGPSTARNLGGRVAGGVIDPVSRALSGGVSAARGGISTIDAHGTYEDRRAADKASGADLYELARQRVLDRRTPKTD